MKRLVIRAFGKEVLFIQLGESENLAPDFTSHPVGFTTPPILPDQLGLPKRDQEDA